MVRINKIYTRTGDDGTTGLIGGRRVKKHSLRVAAYGDLDELNACIGQISDQGRTILDHTIQAALLNIQNELFNLGALLASDPGASVQSPAKQAALTQCAKHTQGLESLIDECTKNLPDLKSFVLPGGSLLNSACHVARAVCRRAERSISLLAETEPVEPEILHFINRLSDLLFALARHASHQEKVSERLWVPAE